MLRPMAPASPNRPHVFVDADVIFAGAAAGSEHGASLVLLRLAEITLIDAVTSQQAVVEAERNLADKLPAAVPALRLLIARSLRVTPDPLPEELKPHSGRADPKDLPLLVAALRESCPWLVTFNLRHYRPGHPQVSVLRPGDFIMQVRGLLSQLKPNPMI